MRAKVLGLTLLILVNQSFAASDICTSLKPKAPKQLSTGEVLFLSHGYEVDADGAPNAYLVKGGGLSSICDGVAAVENGKQVTEENDKRWQEKCHLAWETALRTNNFDKSKIKIFGLLTDGDNRPLVQKSTDPYPDTAYISTTSYPIDDAPDNTQSQYVDATKIPYIVLSSKFLNKYKIKKGTLALVYRPLTKKIVPAIYADSSQLGEGSIKLHELLGGKPYRTENGILRAKNSIDDSVITIVFPNIVTTPTIQTEKWLKEINNKGVEVASSNGWTQQKLANCHFK